MSELHLRALGRHRRHALSRRLWGTAAETEPTATARLLLGVAARPATTRDSASGGVRARVPLRLRTRCTGSSLRARHARFEFAAPVGRLGVLENEPEIVAPAL